MTVKAQTTFSIMPQERYSPLDNNDSHQLALIPQCIIPDVRKWFLLELEKIEFVKYVFYQNVYDQNA